MKKSSTIFKVFLFVLLLIAGGLVGYLIGNFAKGNFLIHLPDKIGLTLLVLFIPMFFIVIAVHEGGHAIAGRWVNFDLRMYVVGPFMWEKEKNAWRFKWNRNVNTAGGLVVSLPNGNKDLARRFMAFAAGGPVASLVFALLTFLAFWLYFKNGSSTSVLFQVCSILMVLLSFFSFLIFLVTCIPLHMGGFYTDGARVLRFWRGGETARFEVLLMKIIADTCGGIRPRDLNLTEILEAQEISIKRKDPFQVYIHSFLHHISFDQGDISQAEVHLLDYIGDATHIPAGLRNAVWLDAAFFYAFAKKDLNTAQQYWDKYQKAPMIPKAQILATESAMALLKEEYNTAKSKAEAAISEIPDMLDKGLGVVLKDRMIEIISQCRPIKQ